LCQALICSSELIVYTGLFYLKKYLKELLEIWFIAFKKRLKDGQI